MMIYLFSFRRIMNTIEPMGLPLAQELFFENNRRGMKGIAGWFGFASNMLHGLSKVLCKLLCYQFCICSVSMPVARQRVSFDRNRKTCACSPCMLTLHKKTQVEISEAC